MTVTEFGDSRSQVSVFCAKPVSARYLSLTAKLVHNRTLRSTIVFSGNRRLFIDILITLILITNYSLHVMCEPYFEARHLVLTADYARTIAL